MNSQTRGSPQRIKTLRRSFPADMDQLPSVGPTQLKCLGLPKGTALRMEHVEHLGAVPLVSGRAAIPNCSELRLRHPAAYRRLSFPESRSRAPPARSAGRALG